jgi:hypothetical protein
MPARQRSNFLAQTGETMKLPRRKQKQLEEKGKPASSPMPGGGAMGRLRQFEKERGIEATDLSNPAAEESRKDAKKSQPRRKK